MFEAAELGQKLSKKVFAEREAALRLGLLNAQYDLRETRSPVIVLIAGDDRRGCTALLNRLHYWMDGRYLVTRAFGPPTEAEQLRPLLWRYWSALPPRGRVGLFLGGWAQQALAARLEGGMPDAVYEHALKRFTDLERCLTADGAVVVKLWVHLPRREHEKRLAKARKGRGETRRLDEFDWRICDRYEELAPMAEELVERTTTPDGRWDVVESTDARHRDVTCGERILAAIQGAVAMHASPAPVAADRAPSPRPAASILDSVDLSSALAHEVYKPRLEKLQATLSKHAERAGERGIRTLLVFEGWDAAGKGGVIRRITRPLDARDYRVIPIAAPSEEERRYHYLWRFWRDVPRAGRMVIFDRSWYGRVLVERVEGYASREEWSRSYAEINGFEQSLTDTGTVLLKFWLHVDPEEQLRRFREREQTAYKKYKITEEDYRNRDRWDDYVAAVHDMVESTSTSQAPWHLVPANDKRFARVRVLETLCDGLKRALEKDEPA